MWLGLLIAAGLVIRLLFMGNEGFSSDVSTFEAWALTLAQHPFSEFYASTKFADYPPGYFYILWLVGHLYAAIAPHGNIELLKYLVKLPAVVMDLVDGWLIYAIVRRFASERWALGAAALFILNPAMIFISAAWGQVDSISSGLALWGIYLLLASDDRDERRAVGPIVLAWVALSYSLLIKPQAAVLIPLFLAFAFTRPERLRARLIGTGAGIAAALLFGLLLTLPFHPAYNPVDAYGWLLGKYTFAKNVYSYNSVNAFNLWSILHGFWDPDSQTIAFLPQYIWGIALVAAAVILTVVRYVQARTAQALLESCAILTLAFFMLATRMHERYIFDGLTFAIVCLPFARRYLWASIVFTITLFVNLFYSLTYLYVMSGTVQSAVNPRDIWPAVTHPLSLLNVATFFFLGYMFLGQENVQPSGAGAAPEPEPLVIGPAIATMSRARKWFNPREGLASMVWPLDYLLASLFGVVSFIVSYVNYWLPNEKIFDEIYFARAAEEYLTGKYIYENTHPPLTKLIITLSTMLFGGMPHGDNPAGWRFLDVVFGAIAIVVIYAFAKRLTRSTLFSSFAAIMLVADGMHFVQSRIATPEGIVVVFSLGALYAFYRFWIASQSTVRPFEPNSTLRFAISLAGAIVLGCISGFLVNRFGNPPGQANAAGFIVASVYFGTGWYLLMRLWVVPRCIARPASELITYADGTRILRAGSQLDIQNPYNRAFKKDLTIDEDEAAITYRRDASVSYATPEGSATYTPGEVVDDQGETEKGKHATAWLVAFTVLLGALVASKWYGVMAYGVSFIVIAFVWLQRYWAEGRAKRWGNPYGFRLDVALAAIVFISMSVYVAAWIPELVRHVQPPGDTGAANVSELVYRQYTMFEYHDQLKATHPYQSSWWQWPLDLRPIAYYWKDLRTGTAASDPNACCVAEITSLPNPLIVWFGLLCVPLVAVLAWYEKNKGYALLVLAYLLQWLPWAKSPRITFAYHFYVDVPIIILCNVIILQRLWNWQFGHSESRLYARIAAGAYVAAVVLAFVWFYPILAGVPLPWNQWDARMWLGSHWI
ncbi:MAG TPA: phospholipid carrier-dependent glycosyltransferase [Candidatus Baltobacteraceae bacterium]|nr:phospholipid carrier-dependent glycosyltransferase [Candidatus Baltobacteraceae bacterium]